MRYLLYFSAVFHYNIPMKEKSENLCEICGKNEAVIHVQQIMGSEIIELRLCEECAEKKGISGENTNLDFSISELLTGLLNITSEVKNDKDQSFCRNCGMTYKEFQKEGKLGCPECAQVFRKDIYTILESISGTHQHIGRYPKKLREFKKLLIDKTEMKQKLQEAIKNEDYEAAAIIRDKIHALEQASEGRGD